LELLLLPIAVGALSGSLAGVFGIGGGAILVPVFTNASALPACRWRCGCHSVSALRLRCHPDVDSFVPGAPQAPRPYFFA
jgi:hypothetical protein